MKPVVVGTFSGSARGGAGAKMAGKPVSAVRHRFNGTTDIQSPAYARKGKMQNKVSPFPGDVKSRTRGDAVGTHGNVPGSRRRGLVKYSNLSI